MIMQTQASRTSKTTKNGRGLLGRFRKANSEPETKQISLYGPTRPAPKPIQSTKPQPTRKNPPAPSRNVDQIQPVASSPVRAGHTPPPLRQRRVNRANGGASVPTNAPRPNGNSQNVPPPHNSHLQQSKDSPPCANPNQFQLKQQQQCTTENTVSPIHTLPEPKSIVQNNVSDEPLHKDNHSKIIEGSAGSRIRIVLGGRGSEYLLLLDEDDGQCCWQSKEWKNVPPGLNQQLRKVDHVHQCSFSTNGIDWFLSANCSITGLSKSWWNVSTADFHQALQAGVKSGLQVRVIFGDPALNQYIILLGNNGYTLGSNLPQQVLKTMDQVYNAESTIARIRGLNGHGRFLLEETIVEGDENDDITSEDIVRTRYHSNGLSPYLTEALVHSLKDDTSDLHEIGMGSADKSWILIRDDSYESSIGISDKLVDLLDDFYKRHKERQQACVNGVNHSDEQAKIKAAYARRTYCQAKVQERWQIARQRRSKEDRISEIELRQFKEGDKVTVLGISLFDGDARIKEINYQEGFVVVLCASKMEQNCMVEAIISDPTRILKHNPTDRCNEFNELIQLPLVEDKYQAAMLLNHKHIHNGSCPCMQALIGYSQRFVWPNPFQPGDDVQVTGYAQGKVIEADPKYAQNPYLVHVQYRDGSSYHVAADQVHPMKIAISQDTCPFQISFDKAEQPYLRIRPLFENSEEPLRQGFDEYKCAEKIDVRRLQRLVDNFRMDCAERRKYMNHIVQKLDTDLERNTFELEEYYRKLEQCYDMEETVYSLFEYVKGQPLDVDGFLVHEVQYRHKDIASRGRLFALGRQVHVIQEIFPRTLTLQGVHAELRVALAGAFGHDIDCENSDIRLLCSLANQMGHESMIPSLIDFRNNRETWLCAIQQEHPDIPASEIKRLPNMILCGGTYKAWVHEVGAEYLRNEVSQFCFRLSAEVKAFRDVALNHPRFTWTKQERLKLKNEGFVGDYIDAILLMRVLQACENEVLGILHRTFHNHDCVVRAKIFDGIIVEVREKEVDTGDLIKNCMELAEQTCKERGWDVHLVEKPLYGLQDYPIDCLEDARDVLQVIYGSLIVEENDHEENSEVSILDQSNSIELCVEEDVDEESNEISVLDQSSSVELGVEEDVHEEGSKDSVLHEMNSVEVGVVEKDQEESSSEHSDNSSIE